MLWVDRQLPTMPERASPRAWRLSRKQEILRLLSNQIRYKISGIGGFVWSPTKLPNEHPPRAGVPILNVDDILGSCCLKFVRADACIQTRFK
jgi:hypothetical protein